MYTSVRNVPPVAEATGTSSRAGRVGANVVLLGLVSLLTDLSQEMVVAVLPLYLTFELRLSPLQFGLVDGLYQGATAVVRVLGGLTADRWRRYKEVAAVGYGASALSKLGLVLSLGAWLPTTGALLVDRLGKGVRTAPRDALISLSVEERSLGRAFGVHRALDTCGALLGPLAAFAVLAVAPLAFDAVFVISFLFGLLGLAVLLLFVKNRTPHADGAPEAAATPHVSLRSGLRLFAEKRFRAIVVAGTGLALVTVSDAFVYLVLQRNTDFDARLFPLLFLGTAAAYLVLAVPAGRLADRVGRGRVFLAGHAFLLGVYALLLGEAGPGFVVVALALLGAYYALTDGVLAALASAVLPGGLRTTGLAFLTTGTALARFVSSILFGLVWVAVGVDAAVLCFLVAVLVALPAAGLLLRSARPRPA